VIHGNGTDLGLLKQEGIGSMDAFIAATKNDEVNILAGVLGKHLGVKKSIVMVNRADYDPVVEALGIDAAIHPRLLTANTILKLVRKGNVVSTAILKEGKAEVIEFEALPQSPIVNRRLADVPFPRGTIVGAIVRGNRIIIPRGQDAILPGDRAIVFTLPDVVASVEKHFDAAR
jgi:trk system potassium uptake protein TrkA